MCPPYSVQFSRSVVSDSLRPHKSQHARPPCSSPTPGVHPDSRPSSQWCHPAISSSVVPFSSCPQSLPAWVFSNESTLHMRWPKYWSFSFSISPSKEIPGLISFRTDWLDLLALQFSGIKHIHILVQPSPPPGVHSDSRPSSQWCYPAISSSVVPFSSCAQSLPASESFPMSQLFSWGGPSTGVSALASVLPNDHRKNHSLD